MNMHLNDTKVLGVTAYLKGTKTVFCDSEGKCIVASSELKMYEYFKDADVDKKDFEFRKLRYRQAICVLDAGGVYLFDIESSNRIYPLLKAELPNLIWHPLIREDGAVDSKPFSERFA